MQKQILIAKLFDLDPLDVALGSFELDAKQKLRLKESLDLLEKGVPIDYIIGEADILDLKLKITPNTLIPREETEYWLKQFEAKICHKTNGRSVKVYETQNQNTAKKQNSIFPNRGGNEADSVSPVTAKSNIDSQNYNGTTEAAYTLSKTLIDLGTGTGIIGLYLSKYYDNIAMIDIDHQTIAVARHNVLQNNKLNCQTFVADGLTNINFGLMNNTWDLVANLPYVPNSDQPKASEYKIEYEPEIAIYSGDDGLDLYKQVLEQLHLIQNKPQTVLFELDPRNIQAAKVELDKLNYKSEIWLDQNGLQRVLYGIKI